MRAIRAISIVCLGLTACVRNPATGERQLKLVSEEQEIEMGKQGAQQVDATIGVYEDPELQRYVQQLGERLVAVSERRDLPWTFRVADDPAVNAFALPGGFIYVTRGILAHLDNEAQLVAVLGHEIGHVTAAHSVEQISRAQVAQVGLGVGAALSSEVASLAGVGGAGLQLLFLKFGRDDERQADKLGMRYALKAEYDPREMPKVFETLGRVSEQAGGGQRLPSWLATHPDPEERVEKTRARVEDLERDLDELEVAEGRLMKVIDGILYGDNPRHGFFRGARFYHPELRFSVDFPEGWQAMNGKQAVVAQSPEQDAILQLTSAGKIAPRAALQQFFEQTGARPADETEGLDDGLAAQFTGESEEGRVAGIVAGLEHQGATYLVIGFSAADRYADYARTFRSAITSFTPVQDPAVLDAKPARLQTEKLTQPTSLAQLHQRHPGVPLGELALINQVEEDATLPAGAYAKWVQPGTGATGAEPTPASP